MYNNTTLHKLKLENWRQLLLWITLPTSLILHNALDVLLIFKWFQYIRLDGVSRKYLRRILNNVYSLTLFSHIEVVGVWGSFQPWPLKNKYFYILVYVLLGMDWVERIIVRKYFFSIIIIFSLPYVPLMTTSMESLFLRLPMQISRLNNNKPNLIAHYTYRVKWRNSRLLAQWKDASVYLIE